MLSKTQIVRFVLRDEKVEVGLLWGETNLPSLVMEILAEGEHYGRLELQGKTRETEGGLKLDSFQFPLPLTYNRSIHFLIIVLGHSEVEFGLKSYEWLTKLDESDLSIASMITDRIGRHEVLLPINLNRYKIQKKRKKQLLLLGQTSKNFQFFQLLWLFWSILWLLDLAEWTWYDWLLHLSYYKCPITANCPSTVLDYKCKEWLVKNKAADAPVTFEEIVTVMIKTTRRTTNDKMLISFGHIHFLYFEELNNSIIFMTTFSNICQSG